MKDARFSAPDAPELELPDMDDEPPFDEAELALAAETRRALEDGTEPVAAALQAALCEPRPFDPAVLLARALSEPPDEVASPEERGAAERLRGELERVPISAEVSAERMVAEAMRAAWAPRELPALRHELLVTRALSSAKKPPRRAFVFVAGALALAASVGLAWRVLPGPSSPADGVAVSRSTAALFDPMTPFPRQGGTSERVDRIATARAAELRDNRFAAWGVR